ncbi:MAG: glycine betaine ABC transporter substrate-binding protein [Caldilineaceae bacterium]
MNKYVLIAITILTLIAMQLSNIPKAFARPSATTSSNAPARQDGAKGTITVGSRDFTEQLILGQILVQALRQAGFDVVDSTGLGGTNSAHDALKAGDVDIIWDYIGTILSESHGVPAIALPTDPQIGFEMVASLDLRNNNLIWMVPSAFNDTYTLMVSSESFDPAIQTMEELAAFMNANDAPLKLCVENEFYSRGDGLFSLQNHYGFAFQEANIEIVAYDQLYEGLRSGLCDVAEGFSTDGRIAAWGFRNLDDSRQFFPTYNASPIIRAEVLEQYPELRELLDALGPRLDNDTITRLNARVDLGADGERNTGDEETVEAVALSFLSGAEAAADADAGPTIAVGSRDFTEQLLLGQILVTVLQDAGFNVIDKTGLGGTNSAHDAIKAGDVDIIWDYIGTILSESHGLPAATLPRDPEIGYLMVAALDLRHHNLLWMAPSAFNDTYTLMVRSDSFDPAILTMEDLAAYMNANDAPLKLCVENEFYSRGDGLFSLQEHYGFAFQEANIEIVAYDQLYEGLRNSLCDVAEGFSTDGRIAAWGFRNLDDSLQFFPTYNASPTIRAEMLEKYPELRPLLDALGPLLDNDTITRLNARIDLGADGERNTGDEEPVAQVAYSFARANRLLKLPTIIIASGDDAQQQLLGQMIAQLLAQSGYGVENKTGALQAGSLRQALEGGEIDIYPEGSSVALINYAGLPVTALPSGAERTFALLQALDERNGIIWLQPSTFNAAKALVVGANLAEVDVTTISDLASYMSTSSAALSLCAEADFVEGENAMLEALEAEYGLTFSRDAVTTLAVNDIYDGLRNGSCDVAQAYGVDAHIAAWGLKVLADDREFFPYDQMAATVRKPVLQENLDLADLFAPAFEALTNEAMSQLLARVELGADGEPNSGDEEAPADVAADFLSSLAAE